MCNFHISDYITRINNCIKKNKKILIVKKTKITKKLTKIFKKKKYFKKFEIIKEKILININYKNKTNNNNNSNILKIKTISKPSKRVFIKVKNILIKKNIKIFINTNKGILEDIEAIKKNIGGEVIMEIFKNV